MKRKYMQALWADIYNDIPKLLSLFRIRHYGFHVWKYISTLPNKLIHLTKYDMEEIVQIISRLSRSRIWG